MSDLDKIEQVNLPFFNCETRPLLGPLAIKATERPDNYHQLSATEQWEIDKKLGVLDWDGDLDK